MPNNVSRETVASAQLLGPVQACPAREAAQHLANRICSAEEEALNTCTRSLKHA